MLFRSARLAVPGDRVIVDMTALEALDTAGAWLLYRTLKLLYTQRKRVALRGARDEHEFHYGGEAHIARPTDPEALSDDEWPDDDSFRLDRWQRQPAVRSSSERPSPAARNPSAFGAARRPLPRSSRRRE